MSTLGIDFGTSFSTASYITSDGTPKAVKFPGHDTKMPSLVSYYNNQTIVGYTVTEYLKQISISGQDQLMEDFMKTTIKSIKTNLSVNGQRCGHSHREIVTTIIKHIKTESEKSCSPIIFDNLVLTHPAQFEEWKKDLIKTAAIAAGFNNVQLLPEPVSAAIGYLRCLGHSDLSKTKGLLVYDLGAGTFDVAYVTKQDGHFIVPFPPNGDAHCGGDNLDDALYELLINKARPIIGNGYHTEEKDLGLLFRCRGWKEMLSTLDKIPISIFSQDMSKEFKYDLTRDEFEQIAKPTIRRTINLTKAIADDVKNNRLPLDFILLIGGSSCIPFVEKSLKAAIPDIDIRTTGDADIAVALGASCYAISPIEITPEKEWCYCMYDGKKILRSYNFCIYCGKHNFIKTGKF